MSSREVLQFSARSSRFIKKWDSVSQISQELNIPKGTIFSALKGRSRTSNGYVWMYLRDYRKRRELLS